ncbi:MAG: lipid-A-disaccharide synthase [Chlamydiota bacterium]|jgi:lipid-A-disaccharide synthase
MDLSDVESVDLVISAGEPSGDLHGAALLEALQQKAPNLRIKTVAGPKMRAFATTPIFPMEQLQVMGFTDVIAALPRLTHLFFSLRRAILQCNPKAVICIDYPGFHLRLEQSLRRRGYKGKLIHLVAPTVWAWGKGRIPKMAKTLDLLMTLFPFEKKSFAATSLPVTYVGHPLIAAIPAYREGLKNRETGKEASSDFRSGVSSRALEHGASEDEKSGAKPTPPGTDSSVTSGIATTQSRSNLLALFPGSRVTEVERNFPRQIEAALAIQAKDPSVQIAVSIANDKVRPLLQKHRLKTTWVEPSDKYALMAKAKMALATSGTVTFELALHETPTIVHFAIRPVDSWIAQTILRINLPHYCIVNILADKEIFPEFFGPHFQSKNFIQQSVALWTSASEQSRIQNECRAVRVLMEGKEANPADLILQILSQTGYTTGTI